jgi:hypothetical protein
MGRRRLARLAAAFAAVTGLWMVAAAPAVANDSAVVDDTGWWSRAKQEATLGGALVFPDVAPGQLLVEGTPEGATAIAALRATLPDGAGNPVLTLRAASGVGAETAILLACLSGSGWTGTYAGSWDAKPSPDCSQSVQGIPSDDGSEWTFALAALQFGDQVDVVLTPGAVPDTEDSFGSTFRIVFDRPGPDAITVAEGAAPPPALPDMPSPAPTGGPASSPVAPPVASGSSTPRFDPPVPSPAPVSDQPVIAALPPEEQGATATAPSLRGAQPLAAPPITRTSGADGRMLGVLVVLCAGALLYWSTQLPVPEHRVLSRFASAAPTSSVAAAASPAPVLGGLGRFRRERTGPAKRLG